MRVIAANVIDAVLAPCSKVSNRDRKDHDLPLRYRRFRELVWLALKRAGVGVNWVLDVCVVA